MLQTDPDFRLKRPSITKPGVNLFMQVLFRIENAWFQEDVCVFSSEESRRRAEQYSTGTNLLEQVYMSLHVASTYELVGSVF